MEVLTGMLAGVWSVGHTLMCWTFRVRLLRRGSWVALSLPWSAFPATSHGRTCVLCEGLLLGVEIYKLCGDDAYGISWRSWALLAYACYTRRTWSGEGFGESSIIFRNRV